jgi:hypothetical protein
MAPFQPQHLQPENKVEKGVLFFNGQKLSINSPRLPRNSPQLHHKLPPHFTTKSQKPPVKLHLSPRANQKVRKASRHCVF